MRELHVFCPCEGDWRAISFYWVGLTPWAGNITGQVTLNIDGFAVPATVAGTYTVTSDCTGTLSLSTNLGIPVHESIVVLSKQSFLAVDTDSYVVVTRTMERIRD